MMKSTTTPVSWMLSLFFRHASFPTLLFELLMSLPFSFRVVYTGARLIFLPSSAGIDNLVPIYHGVSLAHAGLCTLPNRNHIEQRNPDDLLLS